MASNEPNSLVRMAYVAAYSASRYHSVLGRINKPFNSLLGETYELVTTKYRYISEQVSHHPPITAFHCESSQYDVFAQTRSSMKFNGRYISYAPNERIYINLKLSDGTTEFYSCT